MAKGTEYTAQRAGWYGLPAQQEGESDQDFRDRVAAELRNRGHLIEAHEALNNCLFDDPTGGERVMDGIIGAVAMERQGVDYGHRDFRRLEDESVAGGYVRNKRPDPSPEALLMMIALLGDRR